MSHPALDLADPGLAAGLQGRDLVISASAGSGKTFTLVTLVLGFLGRNGHRPHQVVATTFSRESAADLKARILEPLDVLAALEEATWARLLEAFREGWAAWDGAVEGLGLRGEIRFAARQWREEGGVPAWSHTAGSARTHWVRARREAERLTVATVHGLALDLLGARSRGRGEAPQALMDPKDGRLLALLRRAGRTHLALAPGHPDHLPARRLLAWLEGREGQEGRWEALAAAHDAHTDALGAWRASSELEAVREAFWDQARRGLEAHRPFAETPELAAARTKDGAPMKNFERYGRGKFGPVPAPDVPAAGLFRFWEDWFAAFPAEEGLPNYFSEAYAESLAEVREALPDLLEFWTTLLIEPVLRAFEAEKRRRGWRTYGDLVRDALDQLRRRPQEPAPGLLLVDEFQDINPGQEALLRALGARASVRVGDPKQAIYAFRGGEAELLKAALAEAALRGGAYRLPANHRSSAPVVQAANTYVAEVVPQLDPGAADPDGVQAHTGRGLGQPLVVVAPVPSGKTRGGDLPAAAPWIAALVREQGWPAGSPATCGGSRTRALLLPRRTGLPALRRALQARGVDPVVVSRDGFWESPGVRALATLLEALARPREPRPLFALLRGPWFGLADPQLHDLAPTLAEGWADLEADGLPGPAGEAVAWLRGLARLSTGAVFAAGLARPGLLEALGALEVHGALEPERARRNLDRFLDLALELPAHLGAAWAELSRRRRTEAGDAPPPGGGEGALLIQTVHASKGLEYDDVLLPMLASRTQGLRRGHLARLDGGSHLVLGWKLGKAAGPRLQALQAEEARRRRREDLNLLYVGLTRARGRLALLQQALPPPESASKASKPATPKSIPWNRVAEDLAARAELPRLDPPPELDPMPSQAQDLPAPPPERPSASERPAPSPETPERAARRREGTLLHALLRECLVRAAVDPSAVQAHLSRSPLAAQVTGAGAKVEAFLAALAARGWADLPRRTELPLPGAGVAGGMGYADLVLWAPDRAAPSKIHLVDFKLASELDPARLEAYARQLQGYAAALKARHPQAGLQAHLWDLEAGRWVDLAV
jgi:ATP-dependent exoDNAse (exonuclease V) beta subunit